MAGLFDYVNYKVVLKPDSVVIPPFIDIWERDKTKGKHKATKELSYVYFICDFKSPYSIYSDEDRPSKVKEDFIKDSKWKPDSMIKAAMIKYNEFQNTYTMRFLKKARGGVDKMSAYFDEVDFNEMDEKGNPVYKATDLSRNLKDVGHIIESLDKVENQVRKEIDAKAKIKGRKKIKGRER